MGLLPERIWKLRSRVPAALREGSRKGGERGRGSGAKIENAFYGTLKMPHPQILQLRILLFSSLERT